MFGAIARPASRIACSVHHQYSSSVSPFQANTGMPRGSSGVPSGPTATAAAAWSWVEKMLQLHQRTSAPSAVSVSISTAVWIVMCSEPMIRAPFSGCSAANSRRIAIRPGISCSASVISLRPKSASERSATLKSVSVATAGGVITDMTKPPVDQVSALAAEEGRAWRIRARRSAPRPAPKVSHRRALPQASSALSCSISCTGPGSTPRSVAR